MPPQERHILLRYIQPGLVGLIDGTLSTLAPIFAAALASGTHTAFLVGLATALGAGISMGFSEALSDNGQYTGRGTGATRGLVTGLMTTIGGVFHTLPFLITSLRYALISVGIVVGIELAAISLVRKRFLQISLRISVVQVVLAATLIIASSIVIGNS